MYLGRSRNREDIITLCQEPCERQLCHGVPFGLGNCGNPVHDGQILLQVLITEPRQDRTLITGLGKVLACAKRSGQEAIAERTVRDNGYAKLACGFKQADLRRFFFY